MTKRTKQGIIDLSVFRNKKMEERKASFDARAIIDTIPSGFETTLNNGEPTRLNTVSAVCTPEKIMIVLQDDNDKEEAPFLMVAPHKDDKFVNELRPAEEEELLEFQSIMREHEEKVKSGEADVIEQSTEDAPF
ncbi:hypothetical protein [Fictibacillus arsenicus]|uniref:Uncharacterized protein n=1 Tax=Fictibacillus arsenicus TaxID=255247 RepID=A0A1V3GCB7_9BACL|nr:hypothetical protein [Fictibacillus arsenicus]OOE14031.1 hypothetical protein UN64_02120 [Fictibacillus arsenicus]